MNARLVVVLAALYLAGCSKHAAKKEIHFSYSDGSQSSFVTTVAEQLSALSEADPLADSKDAYRKKDFRLVGNQGISLSTPGVRLESSKSLLGPQRLIGVKTVSGTSDMIVSPEHEQMIRRAHEYATTYNTHMIILLTTGGKEAPNQATEATRGK